MHVKYIERSRDFNRPKPSYEIYEPSNFKRPNGNWNKFLFFILIGIASLFVLQALAKKGNKKEDFIVIKDGEPVLAPWREEKLNKEIEEIDDAEQYVLFAGIPGTYPCYSCTDGKTEIYLNTFMVWRYGVTRKGQDGRYQSGMPDPRLRYRTQFRGTFSECLKEEKRKIYQYAVLPENLARKNRLIRPPGNKNDN